MSEKDGGPAFPSLAPLERYDEDRGKYETFHMPVGGMSLRDHFAGQALGGLLSKQTDGTFMPSRNGVMNAAAWSYEYADAMLKAREATK